MKVKSSRTPSYNAAIAGEGGGSGRASPANRSASLSTAGGRPRCACMSRAGQGVRWGTLGSPYA